MKKTALRTLALLLVLTMALTPMALASGTYYITLSIKGPDMDGYTQTVTDYSSVYGSLDSLLAAEVVTIIQNNYQLLAKTFSGTGLGEKVSSGLDAFTNDETWKNYVDTEYDNVESAAGLKDLLVDKTSTFADLTVGETYAMSWTGGKANGTYYVTIVLNNYHPGDAINTGAFRDVTENDYFSTSVTWAVDNGITNGMGSGLFAPNEICTRGQIVTFLWRAAGSPAAKTEADFEDVSADAYYAQAVAWAVENGITNGTDETHFSPEATCTRGQAVTFLWRALGGVETGAVTETGFTDVAADAYYAEAVVWAVENEITEGIGDGLFAPENGCTRGQIVTFLYRAYK